MDKLAKFGEKVGINIYQVTMSLDFQQNKSLHFIKAIMYTCSCKFTDWLKTSSPKGNDCSPESQQVIKMVLK